MLTTNRQACDLDRAYACCEAITRREGKNFHWGFRFLPAPQRRALSALYAFARATDDIVDNENASIEARSAEIRKWRETTRRSLEGQGEGPRGRDPGGGTLPLPASSAEDPDHPVHAALADSVRRYSMPIDELFLLIDGCEQDLTVRRYATYDETLGYCRKVAVTIGLSMLAIFESPDDESRCAMMSIGNAFQLTNILRDIPEDLRRDRIYLPADEMKRFGVTEDDLAAGVMTAGLREFLEEMTRRTAVAYVQARPLYDRLKPGPAKTMRAMGRIYQAILDQIRRQDYDVWSRRPRVSVATKLLIVGKTTLGL